MKIALFLVYLALRTMVVAGVDDEQVAPGDFAAGAADGGDDLFVDAAKCTFSDLPSWIGRQSGDTDQTVVGLLTRLMGAGIQLRVLVWLPRAATPRVGEHIEAHWQLAEKIRIEAEALGDSLRGVVGLDLRDSEALLDELWSHVDRPEFAWEHRWRVGDLVLWDNRCTMHRRDAFDPTSRRIMHRTQVKGERRPAA